RSFGSARLASRTLPGASLPASAPSDTVPTFQLRARVVSIHGGPPAGRKFAFRLAAPDAPVFSVGDAWSDWLRFDRPHAEAAHRGVLPPESPVILHLRVDGVVDPTL